jgi:hypothetical protein
MRKLIQAIALGMAVVAYSAPAAATERATAGRRRLHDPIELNDADLLIAHAFRVVHGFNVSAARHAMQYAAPSIFSCAQRLPSVIVADLLQSRSTSALDCVLSNFICARSLL